MRLLATGALAVVILARIGAPPAAQSAAPPATLAALSWLAGDWVGSRGTTSFEERWTPAAGGAMLSVARTVANGRMVAFEFLRIVERDGSLVYIAQPNGRPPTEFRLARIAANEVVFDNAAHDYPQRITYTHAAGDAMTAVTSDITGAKRQVFDFRRSR